MEGSKQTGDSNPAAPELDEDKARLIGSIIADWIATLGEDVAYVDGGVVIIGERGSGRPAPRSTQRAYLDADNGGYVVDVVPVHGNGLAPQHGYAAMASNRGQCSEGRSVEGMNPAQSTGSIGSTLWTSDRTEFAQ